MNAPLVLERVWCRFLCKALYVRYTQATFSHVDSFGEAFPTPKCDYQNHCDIRRSLYYHICVISVSIGSICYSAPLFKSMFVNRPPHSTYYYAEKCHFASAFVKVQSLFVLEFSLAPLLAVVVSLAGSFAWITCFYKELTRNIQYRIQFEK